MPSMLGHLLGPATQRRGEADFCEFELSLVWIASSRPVMATQSDCQKKKKSKNYPKIESISFSDVYLLNKQTQILKHQKTRSVNNSFELHHNQSEPYSHICMRIYNYIYFINMYFFDIAVADLVDDFGSKVQLTFPEMPSNCRIPNYSLCLHNPAEPPTSFLQTSASQSVPGSTSQTGLQVVRSEGRGFSLGDPSALRIGLTDSTVLTRAPSFKTRKCCLCLW